MATLGALARASLSPRARRPVPRSTRRGDLAVLGARRRRRKGARDAEPTGSSPDAAEPPPPGSSSASAPSASSASSPSPAPPPPPLPPPGDDAPLPAVTRDAVMDSCYGTTFWMLALGVVAREATHFGQGSALVPPSVDDWTSALPLVSALHPPSAPADIAAHFAVACACAAAVTAARRAVLRVSSDFAAATDRSNAQVLTPLRRGATSAGDLVTVSFLPAVAEETLFRGALIPALGGGPVAVVASGCVFGALHVGGGRNAAFAAWAALVGCLYGAAAVGTGDVAVAMLAHGLANYASAATWLEENDDSVTDHR